MMKNVQFDVIMPCYNSSAYVAQAVQSLLNQTYPNWNLIAVNDGSTDNTLEILSRFAYKDSRIKVFSKKNGGYATAVNAGLNQITGDYFLMLGSDDSFSKTLFEDLVKAISFEKEFPDMVAFRAVKMKNGRFLERDLISNYESLLSLTNTSIFEFEKEYPQSARFFFIRDTAKCYKTSKLGKLRYFGKSGFDSDGIFSTLFARKCNSFLCLPIDGYLWTIRGDSVSASVSFEKNLDRMRNWGQYVRKLKKEKPAAITGQEKRYIVMPFKVGKELLAQKRLLSPVDFFKLHFSLKTAITLSKKHEIYLFEYHKIFEGNRMKRFVFELFPILWLRRK